MTMNFCPHCGGDLQPQPSNPAPAQSRKTVIQREVTSREVEAVWGIAPMPAGIKPFGIVTDGLSEVPQALAAESNDGKLWELCKGEVKLLDLAAPTGQEQQSAVVPGHVCAMLNAEGREALGARTYGSGRG